LYGCVSEVRLVTPWRSFSIAIPIQASARICLGRNGCFILSPLPAISSLSWIRHRCTSVEFRRMLLRFPGTLQLSYRRIRISLTGFQRPPKPASAPEITSSAPAGSRVRSCRELPHCLTWRRIPGAAMSARLEYVKEHTPTSHPDRELCIMSPEFPKNAKVRPGDPMVVGPEPPAWRGAWNSSRCPLDSQVARIKVWRSR